MSAVFPDVLNTKDFLSIYPQFTNMATAVLNNLWVKTSKISPSFLWDYTQAEALVYWYTALAHLCQLYLTRQAGRVTAATTGNTTTTFENMPDTSAGSLQWWCQTSHGSEIAQLIRGYGGFDYVI